MATAYVMTFWVNVDTEAHALEGFGNIRDEVLSNLVGNQAGWDPEYADGCIAQLTNAVKLVQG